MRVLKKQWVKKQIRGRSQPTFHLSIHSTSCKIERPFSVKTKKKPSQITAGVYPKTCIK